MKRPELASTIIAGLFGALVLWILVRGFKETGSAWYFPAIGFVTGAAVQIGVRLAGVS